MNQGLFGALEQYWSIEPKVRLHRRNTYFEDVRLTNVDALRVGIVASAVLLVTVFFFGMMGCLAV